MWFVVKGGWPQMILLFLIMRCTPTIRELIEATPLSPSSPSATSLSALAPAQRAGAQRLCAMAPFGPSAVSAVRSLTGVNRTRRGKSISAAKDPNRTFGSGRRELVTLRDAGTYIAMHAREGSAPQAHLLKMSRW